MPAGLTTIFTGLLGTAGVAAGAADVLAPILGDAAFGSVLGGGVSALEGKGFGKGALTGAVTGGFLGAAPEIGSALGIGSGAADVLAGAAGGLTGAGLTGGNLGTGTLFGGLEGGAVALLSGGGGSSSTPLGSPSGASPSVGGAAAGGAPAASAISSGGVPDLTANFGSVNTSALTGPASGIEGITVPSGGISDGGLNLGGTIAATAGGLGTSGALSGTPPLTGPAGSTPLQLASDGSVIAPANYGAVPSQSPTSADYTPVLNGGGTGTALTTGTTQAGAAPGAAAKGPSSVSQFLSNPSLKSAGNILTSNPATVLGLGGLAYEAATQPKLPSTSALVGDLQGQANQLSAQGSSLMSFINNGTLPPGAMSIVNSATQAAKARVKSQYAGLGLSGSTAEASALAGIDQQASGQIFQIADQLFNDGVKESGLSTEIYTSLLKETDTQTAEMRSAISNFAASIAGGGNRPVLLNIGGTGA